MRTHRLTLAVLVTALTLGVLLTLAKAPAFAVNGHSQLPFTSFGSFANATGVAVDQSNGNVFVADIGSHVIHVFNAEGSSPAGGIPAELTGANTPAKSFVFGGEPAGVAVDPSSGAIYVTDAKHSVVNKFRVNSSKEYEYVCQFTGFGFVGSACLKNEPIKEGAASGFSFDEPLGVAVDREGDLYIADWGGQSVYEYNSAGEDIRQMEIIGHPQDVAVDYRGDIYVRRYFNGVTYELKRQSLAGPVESEEVKGTATGVASDVATRSVFIGFGSFIGEYAEAGESLTTFGSSVVSVPRGMAVDEASDDVYVVNGSGSTVDVFGPVALASPTTGGSLAVSPTSQTVEGAVNPESETLGATCEVQYGTTTSYGTTAPCSPAEVGAGELPTSVTASLTGLEPSAIYHYRVVATNTNGPYNGKDKTFTALPAVEGVLTSEANKLLPTSAVLHGTLEPNGTDARYYFQYGETEGYGLNSPALPGIDAGTGKEISASTSLSKLTPDTLYHFRLVASNALGTTFGQDKTFRTPLAVMGVFTDEVSELLPTSATVHGSLKPNGIDAHYYFEYGETEGYGFNSSLPPGTNTGTVGEASAVANLTGLIPGTLYHYRLVATNEFGSTLGEDRTFTTTPAVARVRTVKASEVGNTTATLQGSFFPNGIHTNYYFEYGETEGYGLTSPTPPGTNAEGTSEVLATTSIGGLKPNTVYYYRLVATNEFGTTHSGEAGEFATLPNNPKVTNESASKIGSREALLSAMVSPEDASTTYHFVYGPTEAYGSRAPVGELTLGSGPNLLQALFTVEGLLPGTTYHYAIAATNRGGTRIGLDQTFTTAVAALPEVVTGVPGEVGPNSVVLQGTVSPNRVPTVYEFDLGTDTTYGSRVFGEAGSTSGVLGVSVGVQGLQAGTIYHYRLLASNTYGTVYGADQVFITPGFPTASLVAPSGVSLVPTPVFAFPSVTGAITVETVSKPKAKKKARAKKGRKARKAKARRVGKARRGRRAHAGRGGQR